MSQFVPLSAWNEWFPVRCFGDFEPRRASEDCTGCLLRRTFLARQLSSSNDWQTS